MGGILVFGSSKMKRGSQLTAVALLGKKRLRLWR